MSNLFRRKLLDAWAVGWSSLAPILKPACPVCCGSTISRKGYDRVFRQCTRCDFIFSHDYPEFAAELGMGMTGSWGGVSKGGEREDYLTRMLVREFDARNILLYGVGSALAFPVLLQEGFEVHGTDVSSDVIAYRQKEAGKRFFHASDLAKISAAYDGVIACEVFEHFHAPPRWLGQIVKSLKPGGTLCGTTNFYPGGPIEDSQKIGYMSLRGHVAYWSEKALATALQPHGMTVVLFEMVCPGSVKPDKTYNDLFPNKRVFFASSDTRKIARLRQLKQETPILPIDLSDYPHPAYR